MVGVGVERGDYSRNEKRGRLHQVTRGELEGQEAIKERTCKDHIVMRTSRHSSEQPIQLQLD
jgi:hypothetical protein